ncbi:MAG: helix-turn-helix domain-containing protein [Lentisphaerae bacterium]|nr:helix-turn-helix domain-containing protein [Lentisphaerota bacterium]MBT4820897.1 helix-turn-helix domain-containing protein [Lentisphaerota bacterium]MBT5610750.1 helix-turn-helix domain-containing protein [Lentisphaerota bacterium]MBT7060832.1 helix-turn-helix domain-containing protein [Lentisphaerota bacterium]MBT7841279.1 helix-turn-helix domain-containing protein [Lentisphaerota bacterium]
MSTQTEGTQTMPGNDLVQSLARGLDLVRLLAESERGLRLPEIVSATGLKRPTLHNLLKTLCSRGFVCKTGPVYQVGPAMHTLVAEDSSSAYMRQAEEAVRALSLRLPDAIVSFAQPMGGEVVVRFRKFPERLLVEHNSGAVMAPYQTASGLACLAFSGPETRHSIDMRHPFTLSGLGVWENEKQLEDFLGETRSRGWVLPPFSKDSRFRVAAVPSFSADGKLRGVLGAAWHSDPKQKDDKTEDILATLQEITACQLSEAGPEQ